jgi:phytoene dehydrogenase-like protein
VGSFDSRDASAWDQLAGQWERLSPRLIETLMRPFPPVRPAAGLVRRLGVQDALRFARFATLPVRRYAQEQFNGEGAGQLTAALVARFQSRGGLIECGTAADRVLVSDARATGVRLTDGRTVRAGRAVLEDVSAPALYHFLLGPDLLPARLRADLENFAWDDGTIKVD